MAITRKNAGGIITVAVKAESVINAGGFVLTDSTGYAVAGSNLSGGKFIGIAVHGVDATGLSSGDIFVKVYRQGLFKMAATSIAVTMQGAMMYCNGAATFDDTTSNLVAVGKLVKYISSVLGWIDIQADAGAAGAAGANGFPALVVTFPLFTGWVKDGTVKTIVLPALELPVNHQITAAFVMLGTAPGTGKTFTAKINTNTIAVIADTAVVGEDKALAIDINADTDLVVTVSETAAGAGANCSIMLVIEAAA